MRSMCAIDQCPQAFRLGRILFFRLIQFKADFIFDPGQIPFRVSTSVLPCSGASASHASFFSPSTIITRTLPSSSWLFNVVCSMSVSF